MLIHQHHQHGFRHHGSLIHENSDVGWAHRGDQSVMASSSSLPVGATASSKHAMYLCTLLLSSRRPPRILHHMSSMAMCFSLYWTTTQCPKGSLSNVWEHKSLPRVDLHVSSN